jgi:hypothetical protein
VRLVLSLEDIAAGFLETARAHEREAYRLRKLADRMLFPESGTRVEYGGDVVRFVMPLAASNWCKRP